MGTAASVFLFVGAWGDAANGWPNRTAPSGLTFAQINRDLAGARVESVPCDTDLSFKPVPDAPLPECVFVADDSSMPRRAILLGDSHATIMTEAITKRLTSAGYETVVATFGGCIPFPGYRTKARDCNAANAAMYRHVAKSNYDLIVLAFRPQPVMFEDYRILPAKNSDMLSNRPFDVQEMLHTGLKQLLDTGADLVVFEPVPEMPKDIGRFARNRFAFDADYETLTFSLPFAAYLRRTKPVLDTLHGISSPNLSIVKTSQILCDGVDTACYGIESGVALYVDDNHLSRFGIDKLMAGVDGELLSVPAVN